MSTMKILLTLIVVLTFVTAKRQLPKYITKCKRSDPDLGLCIKTQVEKLRPRLLKGIPELGIPPYDPMKIPEVKLEQGTDAVKFKALFSNVTVYGSKNVRIDEIKVNLKDLRLDIRLYFPKLRIKTIYDIGGKVLVLPVVGQGASDGNYTNVVSNVTLAGEYETRNGDKYIKLTDKKVKMTIGASTMYFDNLFNGNKQLTESTNKFINAHWADIIKELTPVLEDTISSLVYELVKHVFDIFPYNEILPP